MADAKGKIQAQLSALNLRVQGMAQEAERQREEISGYRNWFADAFSESALAFSFFDRSLDAALAAERRAFQFLKRGDQASAQRFVQLAESYIKLADHSYLKTHQEKQDGAVWGAVSHVTAGAVGAGAAVGAFVAGAAGLTGAIAGGTAIGGHMVLAEVLLLQNTERKPDRDEVLAFAKQELEKYQVDKNTPLSKQFGEFFFATEWLEDDAPPYSLALQFWRNKIDEFQENHDNVSISRFMTRLYADFGLGAYQDDLALLTDYFFKGRGNCESRSKLILSAFAATQTKVPAGFQLGVQVFTDHVQMVAYQPGKVFDLLSGKTANQIKAPIYHPNYFFHVYLEDSLSGSPLQLEDLLLVDVDPQFANQEEAGGKTNSNLHLLGGKGVYQIGPNPYQADEANPYASNAGHTNSLAETSTVASQEATFVQDHVRIERMNSLQFQSSSTVQPELPLLILPAEVFDEVKHGGFSLEEMVVKAAQWDFKDRAEQDDIAVFEQEQFDYEHFFQVAKNRWARLDAVDNEPVTDVMKSYRKTMKDLLYGEKLELVGIDRQEVQKNILAQNPGFKKLQELSEDIDAHFHPFLTELNKLPPWEISSAYDLLGQLDKIFEGRFQKRFIQELQSGAIAYDVTSQNKGNADCDPEPALLSADLETGMITFLQAGKSCGKKAEALLSYQTAAILLFNIETEECWPLWTAQHSAAFVEMIRHNALPFSHQWVEDNIALIAQARGKRAPASYQGEKTADGYILDQDLIALEKANAEAHSLP